MLRKKYIFLFLVLSLIFLIPAGCGLTDDINLFDNEKKQKAEELKPDEFKIYFTDKDMNGLYYEIIKLAGVSNDTMLYELVNSFDVTPDNPEYQKLKPESVVIKSYEFGQDGQLIIRFSSEYLEMPALQEILFRASVVKTLCQLPNVTYVEFYIDEQPLMISEIPVGQMASTDFIDNTGTSTEFRQSLELVIYLTDIDGKMLKESSLIVESDGTYTVEELVINQIINGPLSNQHLLYPVVSPDTRINKIHTVDGICYVDFNEEFLNKPENVSDEVVVYSFVNSLCEINEVTKVKITVNGEDRKNFGSVSLSDLLVLKPELIELEKAGE